MSKDFEYGQTYQQYLNRRDHTINPEMRKAIDEAVAAGLVQRIPTGKQTLFPTYEWDKTKNQLAQVTGPTYREQMARGFLTQGPKNINRVNEEKKKKAEQREKEILELLLQEKSVDEVIAIRAALGESHNTTGKLARKILKQLIDKELER